VLRIISAFGILLLLMLTICNEVIASADGDVLCGPEALYEIARLKGIDASISEFVDITNPGEFGVSIKDLIYAADNKGMHPKYKKYGRNDLGSIEFPCIIYLNPGHFSVIKNIRKNKITVFDYAVNNKEIEIDELFKLWDGHAIVFLEDSSLLHGFLNEYYWFTSPMVCLIAWIYVMRAYRPFLKK
jgi:ABC-type bacteriocin/lantibiotic exporter with double-glycine peptidase domain